MTKQVAPNGCMFCETPKDKHPPMGNELHPRGVWTWVEPSDKLRLQRMKRNRQIREGFAMDEVMDIRDAWLDRWVTYHGERRRSELGNGQKFKVVDVRQDGRSIAFDAGIFGIQWCAVDSVQVVTPEISTKALSVDDFMNPHRSTIETLDAEIKRLQDRINDLRAARQVISGL
jgi:hypothetical protein